MRTIGRLILILLHLIKAIWIILWQRSQRLQDGTRIIPPEMAAAWSRRLLQLLGIRLQVQGELASGAHLIVANHVSWLDISVIHALTGAAFLSKASVRHWPLIGWFAQSIGTLFIQRGKGEAHQIAAQIADRLQQGQSIILFPEGRINRPPQISTFFPRLFAAAIAAQVPVQPIALIYRYQGQIDQDIVYMGDNTLMRIFWRLLRRPETEVMAVLCPPIAISQGMERKPLAKAAQQAIEEAIESYLKR